MPVHVVENSIITKSLSAVAELVGHLGLTAGSVRVQTRPIVRDIHPTSGASLLHGNPSSRSKLRRSTLKRRQGQFSSWRTRDSLNARAALTYLLHSRNKQLLFLRKSRANKSSKATWFTTLVFKRDGSASSARLCVKP